MDSKFKKCKVENGPELNSNMSKIFCTVFVIFPRIYFHNFDINVCAIAYNVLVYLLFFHCIMFCLFFLSSLSCSLTLSIYLLSIL